ncbi:MAG: NADH:flavin oxidoreductase/NADH oxidase [Woeseiaceae bacterium]|nr:NADH:flavin oxidoreductase/NADH oxidase [Woeseiaceae bacterium]
MTDTKPENVPALFRPYSLRELTFSNRVVVTPMCQYIADDGHIVDWHLEHHGRFALGGVGGACVESTGVTRDGRITPGCLGIYLDEHVEGLSRITATYHRHDIPVGIQLSHSGRKGSAAVPLEGAQPLEQGKGAWQTVAPSAIAMTDGWPVPHALSSTEIGELIGEFETAARRAVAADFDFIEVHGAHGYLINSFFSPIANQRDDEWGGDLARRMALPLAVSEAVRSAMPSGMPLFYRTSVVDGFDDGVTIEDSIELARALKQKGVDLLDCSSGGIVGASGRAAERPSPGYLVPYAKTLREEADIPTMAVGLIVEADQANDVVESGSADLVAMGRQLLDDPNFVLHAAQTLGHPDPWSLLPPSYGFFLSRWYR